MQSIFDALLMQGEHPHNDLNPKAIQIEDIVRQDADGWQEGQERVLRYLKAIGVAPVQSLELANETMRRATVQAARGMSAKYHPIQLAMRQLKQVLVECPSDVIRGFCPGMPPRFKNALPVMPEMKRGSMLPDMKSPRFLSNLFDFLISRKSALKADRPFASSGTIRK